MNTPQLPVTTSAEGVNWSISKLFMYEQCPMRFRLKYIERMPEPPQPADSPLERGNRIHKHLERYVKGEENSLVGIEAKGIGSLDPAITQLRELYGAGMATSEEDWWFDQDWNECARSSVWLWSKLDFSVRDESQGLVITGDHKSGKSKYKAVDHIQQTQLYVAVSALKYEWADRHVAEVWYVDEGWIRSQSYTREEALRFVGRFQSRVDRIYRDKFFKPNPSVITCKWCPFSPRGTGSCPVGV